MFFIWPTYIPSMGSLHLILPQCSCLQRFQTPTSVDPRWPWTELKNNRDHVLHLSTLQTKYEVPAPFRSLVIVITKFSNFDPWWPWTRPRNNRDHVLHIANTLAKCEGYAPFPSLVIVFTMFPDFDLQWPWTRPENNGVNVPHMANPYARYEVSVPFRSLVIVFTRGITDTHIPPHHRINSFCLQQGIN